MPRPSSLFPLFADLATIKGIGEKQRTALVNLLGGVRVLDLLLHCPNTLQSRRLLPRLQQHEGLITLEAKVQDHRPPSQKSRPYYVNMEDSTGKPFSLSFFHARGDWLQKQLPVGEVVVVSGRLEFYGYGNSQRLSMPHPDYIVAPDKIDEIPPLEPVYPLTQGISNKVIRKFIKQALPLAMQQPEWVDRALLAREGWPTWAAAIQNLHNPVDEEDWYKAKQRLAFDELLSHQLALNLVRQQTTQLPGQALIGAGKLAKQVEENLPFQLTGAQQRSLLEIREDLQQPQQSLRLLQGDVGSGKTIVAFLAACQAIECGYQAAIMAPTEILARQHFETVLPWVIENNLSHVLLTGSVKGKARKEALEQIADGSVPLIIGTHALFQDKVQFDKLGFVVIDEQHRFGVQQRLLLSGKGTNPHMLVMTATPIPRTLLLANYGDMATSKLDEKPAGRLPIETRVIPNQRLSNVIESLKRSVTSGAQIYWVCPLVEESENLDIAAAEERADLLKKFFGNDVGLVHGRLSGDAKAQALQDFQQQKIKILVATTVIEVGVNVPNATIMVIDHAERFGLAQLHQLRGRVGRGEKASFCLLLYEPPLSKSGKARLEAMRDSEDGFYLAEQDLKLRGSGDVLGSRQSGFPKLRFADWVEDRKLLYMASDAARLLLKQLENQQESKSLQEPVIALDGVSGNVNARDKAEAAKTLLYMFERQQAADYLRAG